MSLTDLLVASSPIIVLMFRLAWRSVPMLVVVPEPDVFRATRLSHL